MPIANVTLAVAGVLSIALCAASVVRTLQLGEIKSIGASGELVRRADDAARYWSLVQLRMAQSVVILALILTIGWRFQL